MGLYNVLFHCDDTRRQEKAYLWATLSLNKYINVTDTVIKVKSITTIRVLKLF